MSETNHRTPPTLKRPTDASGKPQEAADRFGRDVDVYTMFNEEIGRAVDMLYENIDLVPKGLKAAYNELLWAITTDITLDPEAKKLRIKDKIAVFIMGNWRKLNTPKKYTTDELTEQMAIIRSGLDLMPIADEFTLKQHEFARRVGDGMDKLFTKAVAYAKEELQRLGIELKDGEE